MSQKTEKKNLFALAKSSKAKSASPKTYTVSVKTEPFVVVSAYSGALTLTVFPDS